MKYRTKPCEIEAIQWDGTNTDEIRAFGGDAIGETLAREDPQSGVHSLVKMYIHTLEGEMEASLGDYIIKGLRGEFYPCKPDVFEKKYEPVNE